VEIKVEQTELVKALSKYQSLVSRKSTMPILSFCLIETSKNAIFISGSDLEVSVKLQVKAEIVQEGAVGVVAKTLFELVRELNSGTITIKLEAANRVKLTHGRSKFNLVGVDAKDFPSLPGLDSEATLSISADTLAEMINMTLYAVSNDETRYNLSGVCFESPFQDGIRFVATDGHRLALITRKFDNAELIGKLIIPKRGLSESRRIIEDSRGGEINFGVGEDGFFILATDNQHIAIRLIDEDFPSYSEVIPATKGVQIKINCGQFLQCLKRVALIVNEQSRPVKLDFANDVLTLSGYSPEIGDAREELSIEYSTEPISIGFNARYLVELCNAFGESSELVIEILSGMEPTKFYRLGDTSSLAVVMPMRLEGIEELNKASGY
jgi:DNA polymerase III subunit beta